MTWLFLGPDGESADELGPTSLRGAGRGKGSSGKGEARSRKGRGGKKKRSRGRKGKQRKGSTGGKGADSAGAAGGADPAAPGREGEAVSEADHSEEDPEAAEARDRPTPVRDAMEGAEADPSPTEAPARSFSHEGVGWTVRVEGRTRSGRAADAGAPLLHLRFYRGEKEEPERHAVVAGRALDAFYEEELAALLERARPWGPPKPFYEDSSEGKRRPRGR